MYSQSIYVLSENKKKNQQCSTILFLECFRNDLVNCGREGMHKRDRNHYFDIDIERLTRQMTKYIHLGKAKKHTKNNLM